MATISEIKSLLCLDLDNTYGSGLKWIATGKQAGTKAGRYYQVRVQGKYYMAHHIVLLLVDREGILDVRKQGTRKGRLLVVDHINNGTYPYKSNHPNNLQIITQRANQLKGSRCNDREHNYIYITKQGTYQVRVRSLGNGTSKTFKQLEDAVTYRDNLITCNSK